MLRTGFSTCRVDFNRTQSRNLGKPGPEAGFRIKHHKYPYAQVQDKTPGALRLVEERTRTGYPNVRISKWFSSNILKI